MKKMFNGFSAAAKGSRIAREFMFSIVLVSSIITLLLTGLQLGLEFRARIEQIDEQVQLIRDTFLASLITSIWALDVEQIRLQLNGLQHLPYTEYVDIRVGEHIQWSSGEIVSHNIQQTQIPLRYRYNDEDMEIATLHVLASLDKVYWELFHQASIILLSNAVKTFLVAMFILYSFYRLIGRHLEKLADFAHRLDLNNMTSSQLSLERGRSPQAGNDELDKVAQALEQMRQRLRLDLETQKESLTKQRQLEQELTRQRSHVAYLNRVSTLGELATGVAHEIKQPLTAISGYADICRRSLQASRISQPMVCQLLENIHAQAHRASEVIGSIQSMVKKHPIKRSLLKLNDLLVQTIALAEFDASAQGVTIQSQLSAPDALLEADPVQLQQVLLNLMRNAIEASVDSAADEAEILLRTEIDRDHKLKLSISDRGGGVDKAIADKIFTYLFSTKPQGTGMGLAICRSLVEAHDGILDFYNNEQGGATFFLILPVKDWLIEDGRQTNTLNSPESSSIPATATEANLHEK